MKRTNLVLDPDLLKEATRVSGSKTYSGAVNFALKEVVRLARVRRIFDFQGTGVWDGKLSEMRGDRPRHSRH
jgi:Arc/MetJ family transcription regulator